MAGRMAVNHIIPAGVKYQSRLLENLNLMRQNFPDNWQSLASTQVSLIKECSGLLSDIRVRADELDAAREYAESCESAFEKALAAEKVAGILQELRKGIDGLEEITDNDIWPLPKYRELLFIS